MAEHDDHDDGGGTDSGGNGGGSPTVPKARFDQVVAQRRQLAAELNTASERLNALEQQAATWQQTEAQIAAERAAWAEEKAIMTSGITDPEGIDFLRVAWQRVPEAERPNGGISEWVQTPDRLPKAVQVYLPKAQGQQGQGQGQGQGQQTRPVDPRSTNTTGAHQPYSGGAVSRLTPEEYGTSRAAIWESLGLKPPSVPKGVAGSKKD